MKKLLCFLLCLTLIFSSVSLSFAAATDWTTSDSQNLANAAGRLYYMNQSAAYYLYNIASNTNNIYNKCVDIYNALFYSNHNVAYWVAEIQGWMSPIYNAITSIPVDLSTIIGSLGYYDSNNTYHPYLTRLEDLAKANTNIQIGASGFTINDSRIRAHQQLMNDQSQMLYTFPYIDPNGQTHEVNAYWGFGSPIGNLALLMRVMNFNQGNQYKFRWAADLTGYNSTQSLVSFADPDSTVTFTPSSATDGIYKYLNTINTPLARLGYVLASDSRIEAQDAAAANEQAVVDNFIDSSGDGSTSTSDIGSISDLSSGYKQNFGSDASVSGIFNIFDSNNMGWFSQETKNQLDTTTPTRLSKGSESETPLLDKQIEDIYNALGVKQP